MKDGLGAVDVIAKLDVISRQRALTDAESLTLERAIRATEDDPAIRFTKRDAARAGLKRRMGAYRA